MLIWNKAFVSIYGDPNSIFYFFDKKWFLAQMYAHV